MNTLELYINKNGLDETETMNWLLERGLISDLCIRPADVYEADRAVKALENPDDHETVI